jgi:hypothetical protein
MSGSDESGGRESGGSKIVALAAAFAAAFIARKVLTFGWTKITGKEPPGDPHDPHVGIGEALSWAVILGASIEGARLLATRAATRKMRQAPAGEIQQ